MPEQLSDEDADRELAEAEKEFADETGSNIVDVGEPKKEETAEQNQQILAALGFKRYEDTEAIKYSIRVLNTKIGVTFNETNMLGKIWAYKIPEGDEEKKFLKNGDLKAHPLLQKYQAIQEGKESIPKTSVTGKVIEKRGKAIKIEIEENGEKKQIFYGQGAVKKDKDGNYFVPAGFSKATKDHEAKMEMPRDIQLPNYETEMKQAPVADTTKEKDASTEKKEAPTDNTTLANVIHKEPVTLTEGEKPTVDYYVNLIGEITEKVKAEKRISEREHGYAINMVFNAITRDTRTALIAELKNGGSQEEQA